MNSKKVLVLGASGYTGTALVKHLSLQGAEVCAHIRPNSKSLEKKIAEFGNLNERIEVDTTPWDLSAFQKTMEKLPTLMQKN